MGERERFGSSHQRRVVAGFVRRRGGAFHDDFVFGVVLTWAAVEERRAFKPVGAWLFELALAFPRSLRWSGAHGHARRADRRSSEPRDVRLGVGLVGKRDFAAGGDRELARG